MNSDEEFLTRRQVADRLGIKPREVTRLGIPSAFGGKKTERFRWSTVLTWVQEQERNRQRKGKA